VYSTLIILNGNHTGNTKPTKIKNSPGCVIWNKHGLLDTPIAFVALHSISVYCAGDL